MSNIVNGLPEGYGAHPSDTIAIIDGKTVRHCLSMTDCITAMAATMVALYHQQVVLPQRLSCDVNDRQDQLLVMPAAVNDPPLVGVKALTLYANNPSASLPAIQGFISLFDAASGRPVALIDAASITAIRTAAASAAATQVLARQDASILTLIGTGVQAETHLQSILAVRPIKTVNVWGRNKEKAQRFVEGVSATYDVEITVVEDIQTAVQAADIICTLTSAKHALIKGEWLKSGVHINLVGSHSPHRREVDSDTIKQARLFVEVKSAALIEAGDILIPISNNEISSSHILGEIGAVIAGDIPGRESDSDLTVYKSLGNAAQDLVAARIAFEAAQGRGDAQEIVWNT